MVYTNLVLNVQPDSQWITRIIERIKDQPNFGFGFGAESVYCNTFGLLLVSAESSHDTFGKISVSAAVTYK